MQHKSDQPVPEPVVEAIGDSWVSFMLAKQRIIALKSKPTSRKLGILYVNKIISKYEGTHQGKKFKTECENPFRF